MITSGGYYSMPCALYRCARCAMLTWVMQMVGELSTCERGPTPAPVPREYDFSKPAPFCGGELVRCGGEEAAPYHAAFALGGWEAVWPLIHADDERCGGGVA